MKSTAFILFILLSSISSLMGQSFLKGTGVASVGIGLGGSFGSFTYGSQTPGISVQYEKGIWEVSGPGVISLGGYIGVKGYKYGGSSGNFHYSQKWSYTIIGVRGAYHYNGIDNPKIDLYGGLMLSYNILKYKYEDNGGFSTPQSGSYGSAAGLTAFAGGRYFFSKNIGAFAEVGYGVAYLTLGVAVKLGE